jgi:hypothetical protein
MAMKVDDWQASCGLVSIEHWFSNAAAARGLEELRNRQKPSARRAGEEQCLGECLKSRATAIKPVTKSLMQT